MTDTLVIGLGNPILTDDAAGILAAHALRDALPPDAGVDVVEAAVGGLPLMELMIGYRRVILVDAVMLPDRGPGEVIVFTAGDLPTTLNSASSHTTDLPTALSTGRQLGAPLPRNADIQVVGIQAQDVLTFSETPTPPVAEAIPRAANMVLSLLGYSPGD